MSDWLNQCHFGDCIETMRRMPDGIAQTCVTSPPYFGLRDYGHAGQIGLEPTPDQFIAKLVEVFREVKRVLTDDGTLWLNIGDSYAANRSYQVPSTKGGAKHSESQAAGGKGSVVPDGCKTKDLIGIPWLLAFALRADGWYLRQDIIWHKPNPMPESVRDRCTKAHEYIFLLSKSERYFYDVDAIKEPEVMKPQRRLTPRKANPNAKVHDMPVYRQMEGGTGGGMRNRRSVWTVATRPYKGAHFATFPPALIEPCILAGSRPGDLVLDPFMGSGTTAAVSIQHGRGYLGCELNESYKPLQDERLQQPSFQFLEAA